MGLMVWLTKKLYFPNVSNSLFISSHRLTGNFRLGGGGKPFAQKIIASCPNFYKTVEKTTRAIRCNNIGRTGIWKWLDTVFQGQYLPSLSINYGRGHKQTFGKIATTVVLDKGENLSWSGLHWQRSCHSNEMTLLPIILAALFLTGKSFSRAFCSNSRLDVREVKTESVWVLLGYFGIKFLSSEIR